MSVQISMTHSLMLSGRAEVIRIEVYKTLAEFPQSKRPEEIASREVKISFANTEMSINRCLHVRIGYTFNSI